jgi:hypothetical protein
MNKSILLNSLLAFMLTLAVSKPTPAADNGQKANPASLAERDLAAQSRGDVAAALALYSDDAIVQGGGLCWTPCVGKAAIQKELQRRVTANNHATIIGKYVSDNVAVVKSAVRLGVADKSGVNRSIEWSHGVDRITVWSIYEARGDKIAVVTLVGQRTDPQTARFIAWLRSQQQPAK